MKKLKKLLSILLSCLLMLCMSVGCAGCSFKELFAEEPTFTYGDFRCCYVRNAESSFSVRKDVATGVNVFGFVESDKEWGTVIIPETINGLPVISIGRDGFAWSNYLQGYFKKMYIPVTLQFFKPYDMFWHKTIFLIDRQNDELMENRKLLINNRLKSTAHSKFVVFESMYDWYQELFCVEESCSLVIANLTYIVDGVEYWMDDCKDGQYVQIPPTPMKEDFIFDGWYKDEEFLVKWDFSVNRYEKPQDEVSLKLYAKFITKD